MKKIFLIISCAFLFICVSSFKNNYKQDSVLKSTLNNSVFFNFITNNSTTNTIETTIIVDNGAYNTGPRNTGANSSNTIGGAAPDSVNQTITINFGIHVPPHVECWGQFKSPVNGSVTFTGVPIPNNGNLGIYFY